MPPSFHPGELGCASAPPAQGKYQAFGSISSAEDTLAYYKDELPKQGWEIQTSSAAGGTFQIVANKDGREAVLGSSPANEGANLTIVVG
jgi:hypothetical protein